MREPTHWVRWDTVAAIMIILGFEFDSLLGLLVSLSFGAPCIFVCSFFFYKLCVAKTQDVESQTNVARDKSPAGQES